MMKIVVHVLILANLFFGTACNTVQQNRNTNSDDVYYSAKNRNRDTTIITEPVTKQATVNGFRNDSNVFMQEDVSGLMTIGFLQGGGSLIGFDMEIPLSNHLGVQYGAGLFGAGASVCYHLKASSFLSSIAINYWYQGFGDSHVQGLAGPSYIFRSKNKFSAQIGFAKITDRGPLFERVYKKSRPDLIPIFSFGLYFPVRHSGKK